MRSSFLQAYLLGSVLVCIVATGIAAEPSGTCYVYPPWKHTWGVRKATPFKLRLFVGNKTKFSDPQGFACVRLDSWDDPEETEDDDELVVYGVNSGDNCIIYNRSMFSIGVYGLDEGQERFDRPHGITADDKGNVYVVDRGNSRVVHLVNDGKELHFVGAFGEPGSEPGQFIDPRGIDLDGHGRIYVTDSALGCVTIFDADGSVLNRWDGFMGADGISVVGPDERWGARDGEFAVVIDSLHQRLRQLDLHGRVLREIKAVEFGFPAAHLSFCTIDYFNSVLVTDRRNGCIHKFDRKLEYIASFGSTGAGERGFMEPRGIAIYRRLGQLFVAEREGARYMWVGTDVRDFRATVRIDSVWRDLDVDFVLMEPSTCEMDVIDSDNRFITRIVPGRQYGIGPGHFSWNLRLPETTDQKRLMPQIPDKYGLGEMLPKGDYTLQARFKAVYSSREHFVREMEAKFSLP